MNKCLTASRDAADREAVKYTRFCGMNSPTSSLGGWGGSHAVPSTPCVTAYNGEHVWKVDDG